MCESIEQIQKYIDEAKEDGWQLEQLYWEQRLEEVLEIRNKH
jgi:hypothetical protein